LPSKLNFEGDFRFRVEQDWNSKKSDGSYRDDRTRFRYRVRAGVTYNDQWYEAGIRIRTGQQKKQQDPQLTLGEGFKEFGTLPIGFEKVYFQAKWPSFSFWVGKNSFPFEKSNELFWSDNVYPEGIFLNKGIPITSDVIDHLDVRAGHFIISSAGLSLDQDAYMQGFQINTSLLNKHLELFPAIYLFKNIPNIPDGNETFVLDYSILHIGTRVKILLDKPLKAEFDYYENLMDYGKNDSIPSDFKDQKSGIVTGLAYGALQQKGNWAFKVSYAWLQQYSAVDFLAQNDWVRWDYSSNGSPDGRLTNFNGVELIAAYMIVEKMTLKLKYYFVEQLLPFGVSKENGNRIRLDLDFKF